MRFMRNALTWSQPMKVVVVFVVVVVVLLLLVFLLFVLLLFVLLLVVVLLLLWLVTEIYLYSLVKIGLIISHILLSLFLLLFQFCQTPDLGLRLVVDFTFTWDNNNHNDNDNYNNNPHLNFLKGTVLGDEEQGLGKRVKCQGSRDKT